MVSYQNTTESEKFHFQAVSENEIKGIVMSFQSNKAPGYDRVPMAVIKDSLPCILPALTDIVNHSLLSSYFLLPGKYQRSFHFQKMVTMS